MVRDGQNKAGKLWEKSGKESVLEPRNWRAQLLARSVTTVQAEHRRLANAGGMCVVAVAQNTAISTTCAGAASFQISA
jgi:hypothetical protein